MDYFKHSTAIVESDQIGEGTKIWAFAHICKGATIGKECVIGEGVYIGPKVVIGNNVKIQNHSLIYEGVTIENEVFIGPNVVTTNDIRPRAGGDWRKRFKTTLIKTGASVGANSVIVCGLTIGTNAMVGAGSVVTKDVKDCRLVYGNPAREKKEELSTSTRSSNIKFLICGFGKMGKLHKKYLENLNIDWMYYDPILEKNNDINRLENLEDTISNQITHVIISSPEEVHYNNYKFLRNNNFLGPILIEKPAVLKQEHFEVFSDREVVVGLVERHNPVIDTLKKHIDYGNLISVDFIRCSVESVSSKRVNTFVDVGIHDIDLYFYLFGNTYLPDDYHFVWFSNTYKLFLRSKIGFITSFMWSNETAFKERKIIIRHATYTLVVDLIQQEIKKESSDEMGRSITENIYVEKGSSLMNQILKFKDEPTSSNGELAHLFYIQLKEEIEKKKVSFKNVINPVC